MRLILVTIAYYLCGCAPAARQEQPYYGPRFTLGSSKDAVLEIQGTPEKITTFRPPNKEEWWRYSQGSVFFNNGFVVGWEGGAFKDSRLKSELLPTSNSQISRINQGCTVNDVLSVMGSPTTYQVFQSGLVTVGYWPSTIDVRNGVVIGWDNKGNLKL